MRSRKALAWMTLGLLVSTFAPSALAGSGTECVLDCETGIDLPDLEVPDLEVPDLEVPDLEVPDLEVPDLEVPDLEVPDLEVPDLEVPDLEVPDLEEPDLEVPDLDTGEVIQGPDAPELEEPDLDKDGGAVGKVVKEVKSVTEPVTESRPAEDISAADGVHVLVPTAIDNGGSDRKPTTDDSESSEESSDMLGRIPGDLGPRDPDLAIAALDVKSEQGSVNAIETLGSSTPAEIADFVKKAVTHVAFPIGLGIAVLLFLMIQRRIDGRDPKLRVAPVTPDYDQFS